MALAFIGAGSNIRPVQNIKRAVRLLSRSVRINKISTVYCTEPEDRPGQPLYFNCVIEVETDAAPLELKYKILRKIEEELGRIRSRDKYAPRTIDLDIILYDALSFKTDDLEIPDPHISSRPFLANALLEIAPDLVLPGKGLHIRDIALKIGRERMRPLEKYTKALRREIANGIQS